MKIKNNYDEEFEVYKKKNEEIYDLCPTCKNKLKLHLMNLDREIGKHNNIETKTDGNGKNRAASMLKPLNNVTNMIIDGCNQIKNGYYNGSPMTSTAFFERKNIGHSKDEVDKKKIFSTKANTISGTIPPYSFNNMIRTKNDDCSRKISEKNEKTNV